MFYNILWWILCPIFWLLRPWRDKSKRVLIIQNAKIGDYINASILFNAHAKQDVLISAVNYAFAKHDSRIGRIFIFETYKKNLFTKLKLAFILFRTHYEKIYLLTPNAISLFIVQCAMPNQKATLLTYAAKSYEKSLMRGFMITPHTKEDLTLDSYWAMTGHPPLVTYKKSPFSPFYPSPKAMNLNPRPFKIALSLGAGNRFKNIPPLIWSKIIQLLATGGEAELHLLGLPQDEAIWHEILQCGAIPDSFSVVSALGTLPLDEVPAYLKEMQLHVSSDSGNAYIADCYDVAILLLAGPCYMPEQHPTGQKTLILQTDKAPISFIFKSPYASPRSDFFSLTPDQELRIQGFIAELRADFDRQKALSSPPRVF